MMQMNKTHFAILLVCLLSASAIYAYPVQALGNVSIVSYSSFYDSLNALWIVGEVINTGNLATEFTKVTATLYDSTNKVVGIADGYSLVDVIPPNTKSPFDILYLKSQGSLQVITTP